MTWETGMEKIIVNLQGNPSLTTTALHAEGVWVKLFYLDFSFSVSQHILNKDLPKLNYYSFTLKMLTCIF